MANRNYHGSSLLEGSIALARQLYSNVFHVFENTFGPPYCGEYKFEHIPRFLTKHLCGVLGPSGVKKIMPKAMVERAFRFSVDSNSSTYRCLPISEWLPLSLGNYTSWPRCVYKARFPPPKETISPNDDDICRVTYCGHSSLLVQTPRNNFLVDPFFGNRAGPRYLLGSYELLSCGARRVEPPPFTLFDCDAPRIDAFLLTHDHTDSFDKTAIKQLLRLCGPTVIGGRGMSRHVRRKEAPSRYFMDWYDSIRYDGTEIHFLPAVHSSGRGHLLDHNGTLWGSFLICTDQHTVFIAGDTGYSEHFGVISEYVESLDRKIDLSILPIGHYEIGELRNIHLNPEEAVQAHQDLRSRRSMGIKHDTFPLGIERYGQAKRDLFRALREAGVYPHDFFLLEVGQYYQLGEPQGADFDTDSGNEQEGLCRVTDSDLGGWVDRILFDNSNCERVLN